MKSNVRRSSRGRVVFLVGGFMLLILALVLAFFNVPAAIFGGLAGAGIAAIIGAFFVK